ncbi:uncharacterized protein LOC119679035 [Teleopsis dalmanni]|nr:uncharacterized protein LOC119679035 [Teleopsis dalmanni]
MKSLNNLLNTNGGQQMNVNSMKIKTKRNAWTEYSEMHFLELWEEKLPQLRGVRRNGHVFKEMAKELNKRGFKVTGLEVQTKVHNFTQRFKKEQQSDGASEQKPAWKYYHTVKQILTNPNLNATTLMCDSIAEQGTSSNATTLMSQTEKTTPSLPSPTPMDPISDSDNSDHLPRKKRKLNCNDNILDEIRKVNNMEKVQMELQQETDSAFLKIMRRNADSLQRIAEAIERVEANIRITGNH